jgi:predicted nucleotide-binding protein
MKIKYLIVNLEAYKTDLERMLSRFHGTGDAVRIDSSDEPVYRQKILELRDLLADVGQMQYSHQIVGFFSQGIANHLNSPSYASVQRIVGALGALLTRLDRMAEQGQEDLPALKDAVRTNGKVAAVFIGHGHSRLWKDLRDFLVGRLGLKYEEFNREPAAGKSNKERLQEMLDASGFALIVMTGEDEAEDGTRRARENVIHEAGLFQGRLGFEKAIILLEEGCKEFSNIEGLVQLRFPQGNIMAVSEEVRRVLEREGMITSKQAAAQGSD